MSERVFEELSAFLKQVEQRTERHCGYPVNLKYDYTCLLNFFKFSLNNMGDPFFEGNYGINSLKFEQEVISFFAKLYKIAEDDSWGYVNSGGTEGNLYGIFVGREVYPDGILYSSQDSHYSVAKAARLFKITHITTRSQSNGEMEYEHFEELIRENRNSPAIINLNIGTTMKGAIDNLDVVLDILERNTIKDYYIHCDAALSGMILPFLQDAPQVNFNKPIGSVSVSGHKFIGSPVPCGVVLTRKASLEKIEMSIEYLGSKDTTILGSRNGHSPLILWYAIKTRGYDGFAKEAAFCIQNAQYLFRQLRLINYPCMLNNFSNTVVFQKPSDQLVKKWQLATLGNWAHIIVMQNIDQRKIDTFINELKFGEGFNDWNKKLETTTGLSPDEPGNVIEMTSIDRDITSRKQAVEQLLHHVFHDPLTGLPNRALFMDRLGHAVEHAKRYEDCLFAVLFLNLDRFKVINDSLGHTFGDQLLSAIAGRLAACLRSTDTAARLGGDEFTILLEDIKDVSDVVRVVERMQASLAMPFDLGGQEVFTTASIGITLSATGYDRPEDVLRDAEIAMYRAKALGKARYKLFNTDMHATAVARLQLETDLRRAVERQELRIHYQPIVALDTGFITGFEALVRWQHPMRGLVTPTDFIPVAVETGLSIHIDRWVIAQACRQTRLWQEQFPDNPPLTISVNLCSPQIAQPDLIEHIDQVLRETNLDASSLKLEITEDVIMKNSESATVTLSQLRDLGIQLSIDDFGTGYSSLGRLHGFPISVLKIDRSFVSRMSHNEGNLEIVETIVMLAQKLGVDVTAEGVETAEQLAQLRELKCEYGQGYFFSQPLDTEAAEALIAAKS